MCVGGGVVSFRLRKRERKRERESAPERQSAPERAFILTLDY